jgi:hypothetical protein
MTTMLAPCSTCIRETMHEVLHETFSREEDVDVVYAMLKCRGCSTISLGRMVRDVNGDVDKQFYPSPITRKQPSWVIALVLEWEGGEEAADLAALLNEIYQAITGGQYRLAAMGIRALIEQVMIAKVGDVGSFPEKMDRFQRDGYISLIQRDALRETLEIGHAAMHRGFAPKEQELTKALDIVEGIMAAIYDHSKAAADLAKRVPPRKGKP